MSKKPVVVSPDADCEEMNDLYGEDYGYDWIYPKKTDRDRDIERDALKARIAMLREALQAAVKVHGFKGK